MPQSITLPNLFLHAVSRTNTGSNVNGTSASIQNLAGVGHGFVDTSNAFDLLGRTAPGIVCGQAVWEKLSVSTYYRYSDKSQMDNLFTIWRAQSTGSVLCVRDQFGNNFYCKMSKPQLKADVEPNCYTVQFDVEQTSYTEAI